MTGNRAFALLQIKAVDDDRREFAGTATSIEVDRMGDIVVPEGVRAAPEIPLLMFHDHTRVVGRAKLGKATRSGVPFEASIPRVTEPGPLKDELDHAWGLVRHRLTQGVSIGFRTFPDKIEQLQGGGLKFLECEVLELSICAIPANAQATIQVVRSLASAGGRTDSIRTLPRVDRKGIADLVTRTIAEALQEDQKAGRPARGAVAMNKGLTQGMRFLADHMDRLAAEVEQRQAASDQRTVDTAMELLRSFDEKATQLRYCGVARNGTRYEKGNFVTYAGALWHCNTPTTTLPPGHDWTLAVAKGKDAK